MLAGRYRLDAQVGAGGMSTVWRAFDEVLERTVAIKSMLRSVASDSQQLERFRREARAVAQLNHPHIVQVIDVGEDRGAPFIVFEYVAGETLKARIRRLGRLEVTEALAYAIEIARALQAAHDKGIVHRDVKPQNVLIDEDGRAKVTDFGIARTLEEDGLTADGRVLGTTDYVSPEQALGKRVGPPSDLYSLGIVLYEMLVGDVPFKVRTRWPSQCGTCARRCPTSSSCAPATRSRSRSCSTASPPRTPPNGRPTRHRRSPTWRTCSRSNRPAAASRRRGDRDPAVAPEEHPQSRPAAHPLRQAIRRADRADGPAGRRRLRRRRLPHHRQRRARHRVNRGVSAPVKNEREVSIGQTAAEAYDPFGNGDTNDEHAEEAPNVVDGNPETTWSTETYNAGTFAPKPGVGIFIDAEPSVKAASIEIQSETTGWSGAIFAAPNGALPSKVPGNGWVKAATVTNAKSTMKIPLDGTASKDHRYYLVWITGMPEGDNSVALREIVLNRIVAE